MKKPKARFILQTAYGEDFVLSPKLMKQLYKIGFRIGKPPDLEAIRKAIPNEECLKAFEEGLKSSKEEGLKGIRKFIAEWNKTEGTEESEEPAGKTFSMKAPKPKPSKKPPSTHKHIRG